MRTYILLFSFLLSAQAVAWGPIGHRVIGRIAEKHLSQKARKNIERLLKHETIAEVSNHMDFIRSDNTNKHMDPWHYMTIPDGKTYAEAGTPEEGDVFVTIIRLMEELKSKQFTDKDEVFALKCLIHLVGDIHQPLHVGKEGDRGGNSVEVEFYWEKYNLHRVWDSGIIDEQKYSYTEYVEWIHHPTDEQIAEWQAATIMQWVEESMACREQVYNLPENMKINYRYVYDNIELVNKRLLQAGIRLAGVLNQIYG